ncbi:MAG TPA: hypothetical protein VHY10_16185 [Xanthobacteraceae bacterium]|jgi:Mn-dependent DtxR family transcriptional regulator|nr:hypothetical protein [Xanthobacteraceae bacterium]
MSRASAYTAAELATLQRMRAERASTGAIAKALGRSKSSVTNRIERLELRPFYAHIAWSGRTLHADPRALAERDQRLAVAPRDLTAALCGDPLPGYSALERRGGA